MGHCGSEDAIEGAGSGTGQLWAEAPTEGQAPAQGGVLALLLELSCFLNNCKLNFRPYWPAGTPNPIPTLPTSASSVPLLTLPPLNLTPPSVLLGENTPELP